VTTAADLHAIYVADRRCPRFVSMAPCRAAVSMGQAFCGPAAIRSAPMPYLSIKLTRAGGQGAAFMARERGPGLAACETTGSNTSRAARNAPGY